MNACYSALWKNINSTCHRSSSFINASFSNKMTATLPDRKTDPLVWIDLEMTGLDVETDVILEIAVFITDSSPTLAPWIPNTDSSLHLIIHYPQEVLDNMNDWCKKYHGESGLTGRHLNGIRAST